MITIHIGLLPREDAPPGAEAVRNTADYVTTRQLIADALDQDRDVDIYVLTRVCDEWFWDLNQYNDKVQVIDDSPVERLLRKLSISSLPQQLMENPELIIDWGLLDLPTPSDRMLDMWKWIIGHKMGQVWTVEEPSARHLTELVLWYAQHGIEPALKRIAEERGRQWVESASGRLRSAYARFLEKPEENALSLLAWRALLSYGPNLIEPWLADEGWYSAQLGDLVDILELPHGLPKSIRKKLNPKVQTYWNSQVSERFND